MALAVEEAILAENGTLDMPQMVERVLARQLGWSAAGIEDLINALIWIRNHMLEAKFRDYKRYVTDQEWAKIYSDYQNRYAINPRESDKVSAALVAQAIAERQPFAWKPRVLDIGCSTGNFLRHLNRVLPDAALSGGDLMALVIDKCRTDPTLEGISFEIMDVFAIPNRLQFDAIVANAVNVYFEPDEYLRALKSISAALHAGGTYIAYEWVFPREREQRHIEKSQAHPEGLKFWFRSEDFIQRVFREAGFAEVSVIPFEIPIDLPKPIPNGTDADLATYTVIDPVTNRRLMYRGDLYQPWAHIVARRGATPQQ